MSDNIANLDKLIANYNRLFESVTYPGNAVVYERTRTGARVTTYALFLILGLLFVTAGVYFKGPRRPKGRTERLVMPFEADFATCLRGGGISSRIALGASRKAVGRTSSKNCGMCHKKASDGPFPKPCPCGGGCGCY